MKLVKVLLASFLLVGLCAFTGCGKDKDYRAVTGTVTMGGAPLEGCILTFFPEDKETGEGGSAKTDASGAYSATSTGAENGGTGLKPGVYSVTAMKNEEVKNPDDEAFESEDYFFTADMAVHFNYRVTKMLEISIGGGYRMFSGIETNGLENLDFCTPFGELRFTIRE